jgi:hypothetical protein
VDRVEASYKAAKGLIRIKASVDAEKIKDIQIAGDFFMYPEDQLWELELNLVGTSIQRSAIVAKIQSFYRQTEILTTGVVPEDFVEAIIKAITSPSST